MSKKLWCSLRWKRHLKQRHDTEIRKRSRCNRSSRRGKISTLTASVARNNYRARITLKLPSAFSILKNPNETVRFFRDMHTTASKGDIKLDLREIAYITPEAIAALISAITVDPALAGRNVQGNLPLDPQCRQLVVGSGFLKHVRSSENFQHSEQDNGRICRKESRCVEPESARDLIHHGIQKICGTPRPHRPAYRALLELMGNTHNHAAGGKSGPQMWWATVYADKPRNCVCFTFVDSGVGIFRSVQLKALKRMFRKVGIVSESEILQQILEGKIGSRTHLPYRGKGLPAIYEESKKGLLRCLHIITNSVFANVEENHAETLKCEFRGTLIYWEVFLENGTNVSVDC